jgi:hypothetical protein
MNTLHEYLAQRWQAFETRRTEKAPGSADPDAAGHDLAAAPPALYLGVLDSCLTHTFLIPSLDLRVPTDRAPGRVRRQPARRRRRPAVRRGADLPV